MSKVTCPCELLWSHMQCRVGSSSELSRLRSEDVLSVTSFITSELINPGVCCTHLFSPSQTAWRHMQKKCHTSQDFHLYCLYGTPPTGPRFANWFRLYASDGINCLFFLSYVSYHTCHCQVVHSQKHHGQNLDPVLIQQCHLFLDLCFEFKAISSEVYVDICNIHNTNKLHIMSESATWKTMKCI